MTFHHSNMLLLLLLTFTFYLILSINGIFVTPSSEMQLVLFDSAQQREAICNDGSPAGYYLRKGSGDGVDNWVIYLEGGGWCWDVSSCQQRYHSSLGLMSSTPWPKTMQGYALLSADPLINPTFANWNSVFLKYCTSDVFSGNQNITNTTGGYSFKGLKVVTAFIEDLKNLYNLKPTTKILYAGCSAGGQGVVNTLDYAAQLLQGSISSIKGLGDSGWLVNMKPFHSTTQSLSSQMKEALSFWNGSPDKSCVLENKNSPHDCYFSEIAYDYIKTPLFIHTEQYDPWQLGFDTNWASAPFNSTVEEEKYREHFRQRFHSSLHKAVTESSNGGAWSGACYHHCFSAETYYWTTTIHGTSMRTALQDWFMGKQSTDNYLWLDDCHGFNCTSNCPPHPY